MSRRFFPLVTLTLSAVWVAGCSSPESAADRRSPSGVRAVPSSGALHADPDRDGRVTRAEAQADPYLAASFDRYDIDQDEALDRGEFARLEEDASRRPDAASAGAERQALRPREEFPRP